VSADTRALVSTEGAPRRHELVIRATSGWFSLDLADIWRHRDLLLLLVYREFAAKYRQTVLGPAWFVLQPLLLSLVFSVIFGRVARIPTEGAPPMLFYLTGLLAWGYFAQTFQTTATTFVANAGLFGKVYFPRLVMPLSTVITNFISFGLQLAVLLAFWGFFKFATPAGKSFGLEAALVWFPAVILQLAALSLGAGLWLSALTTRYRDFNFLIPFLIQIWMFATPVIYPLSRIPAHWRWLAALNPMTVPVEATKLMFLGAGQITATDVLTSAAVTLVALASGVLVFNRVEKTFVDTI
jgi:lipopolysaccharide transport system permease protein